MKHRCLSHCSWEKELGEESEKEKANRQTWYKSQIAQKHLEVCCTSFSSEFQTVKCLSSYTVITLFFKYKYVSEVELKFIEILYNLYQCCSVCSTETQIQAMCSKWWGWPSQYLRRKITNNKTQKMKIIMQNYNKNQQHSNINNNRRERWTIQNKC